MFCPKCKTEYREGFFECADCYLQLVSELPVENVIIKEIKKPPIKGKPLIAIITLLFSFPVVIWLLVMFSSGSIYYPDVVLVSIT